MFVAVIFLLVLVNQFSGIRDANPDIYWLVSAAVVGFLLLVTKPTFSSILNEPTRAKLLLLPMVIFALYIPLVSGFGGSELRATFKFLVIAGLIYAVYRSSITSNDLVKIVCVVLVIQGGLFFLAFTDWAIVPLDKHYSRHGLSIANYGTIWRLAGLSFPFFVYQTLKSNNPTPSMLNLFLAVIAAAIITLDGTRTGLLILILGGGTATLIAIWVSAQRVRMLRALAAFIAVTLGTLYVIAVAIPGRAYAVYVISQTWHQFKHTGLTLEHLDEFRQRQLETAIAAISQRPLQGQGWLTTISTDNYVIHNVYLQTWSDLGILGMLIYVGIFIPAIWSAIIWFRCNSEQRHSSENKTESDHLLLPITIVFCYLFSSMLHPISTELTEWILIAFSLGLLIRHLTVTSIQDRLESRKYF